VKVRSFLAALAVTLAAGAGLASAGTAQAAPVPTGAAVSAVEAYSDSVGNFSAVFGSTAIPVTGVSAEVPFADTIQFGAASTLGYPVQWHASGLPAGFSLSGAGLLTLNSSQLPGGTTDTFKVEGSELSPGLAVGFVTVTVTPGDTSSTDSVTLALDTVALNAPTNEGGAVTFSTAPSGVPETAVNLPAGVIFSGAAQTLTAGSAVPGDYKLMIVQAKDPAGATATEGFNAVIRYTYAAVPKLSDGHAVEGTSASRENVYFVQSGAASWDHFTIVGPGAINGHQGWVNGQLGLNAAVYGGLEAHHGYTVYYQPVTGQGSTTSVPGSHWGYVYFVS